MNVQIPATDSPDNAEELGSSGVVAPQPRSYEELLPLVRRPELQKAARLSVIGLLMPLQNLMTRQLVQRQADPRWVTVAWLLLSLVSYAISAVGVPWTFVAGAIVLFVAITLDLCDGEVGRAAAMRLSPQENLRTFIYGMYLDRISHGLCTPIWPLAVGWGLDRMLHQPIALAAGLALAVYHTTCRLRPHLKSYLREYFRDRIRQLQGTSEFLCVREKSPQKPGLWRRFGQKIEFWVRNGKRFNFMILVCSLADLVLFYTVGLSYCRILFAAYLIYGALALVLLVQSITTTALGGSLLDETCQGVLRDGS